MKILLVAAEVAPIIKMGGLGDVIGSLPIALEDLGVACDVVVPYFPFAKVESSRLVKHLELQVPYGGQTHQVNVYTALLPGSREVRVHLLQNDNMFHGHSKTWKLQNEQELEVFSFFDRAVVEFVKASFNLYDVVHCHDWHTGLVTHLLQDELGRERPGTLFTVHNLLYQGIGDPTIVRNVGIVPGDHPLIDWDVSDGDLNMIQQGITSSDFINTVSETYRDEIMTAEFGGGLEDILQNRESHTFGILNGIDYKMFPRSYDSTDWQEKKNSAKNALLHKLNLSTDLTKPLYAFVGRMDPHQKGIDLIYSALPEIVAKGGQFVLLGSGNAEWEEKFKEFTKSNAMKNDVSINTLFDPKLAIEIYSGSDFLIAPSRYEPCGLIQLIAMWYGSLPIVRATGGLKDTVTEEVTGYLFEKYDASELIAAIGKSMNRYTTPEHKQMVSNALNKDFSWTKSAKKYQELYQKLIDFRRSNA
jgi:starch synthase